ncbi:hypothetical protein PC41400_21655 [Paenibacillus chitinolyticus]|uniref:Uncharacterized protein n=1 Tax=Paenibacillus chitinolyticus TaxID=79263 RepID=A0A410X0A1_9BACL|nr:hypothetical protein [Paenibacillus chitinolyticus]MCY9593739.1 hypothetical protein [Paenibacillus chitinolyticus]MCY9599696.1 hypothetical protein [Paenibacillus chitinolyticus]QAV20128.1 hypothetical protein PC41400_21655 [Paenibacillus chitinolyticus]
MAVSAIAFKARNKEGRYLCDGVECGDWEDEYLDTLILSDATLIIRNDLSKPDNDDIEDFYKFIASLPLSNDVTFIKEHYDPVEVTLSEEDLKIVRERNDW